MVLLSAQYLSQTADGFAQAVFADVLVLEPNVQGTANRLLGLFVLTLLPYSLLSPFVGVMVDRWKRRSLLLWTNVVRASVLVTLPLWGTLLGGDLALYGAILVLLALGRLFLTTKGASLPHLLGERNLLRGNALSGGGGMISALVGGAAGVGASSIVGTEAAFVLAGVIYAISATIARLIGDPMAHRERRLERVTDAVARVARELISGLRVIWNRSRARLPLIGIFILRTLAIFVGIAAILVIKAEFADAGERSGRLSASALALGIAGAGAFFGALTAPLFGRRFTKPALILLGFGVSGTGLIALGGIVSLPAMLALTFVGGYGAFVAKIAVDTSVQEALPDDVRGRAFSLYDSLYNVASIAAALVMVLFAGTPLRTLLVTAGVAAILMASALGVAMHRAGMLSSVTAAS